MLFYYTYFQINLFIGSNRLLFYATAAMDAAADEMDLKGNPIALSSTWIVKIFHDGLFRSRKEQ